MQQVGWTHAEKLAEIDHITPADVKAFGREVFKRMFMETLIHGNMVPEVKPAFLTRFLMLMIAGRQEFARYAREGARP